ncbi:hypothetical protein BU17DRAFT_94445 [Hysterangium stoloniferum]|nr:hypothetical protein BU17DRAFT_94445 [Hysterangium stoloniferum]
MLDATWNTIDKMVLNAGRRYLFWDAPHAPMYKTMITSQHQGNKKKTTYHLILNRTPKRKAILHLHLNNILLPPILPPRSAQQPQYPPFPTVPP